MARLLKSKQTHATSPCNFRPFIQKFEFRHFWNGAPSKIKTNSRNLTLQFSPIHPNSDQLVSLLASPVNFGWWISFSLTSKSYDPALVYNFVSRDLCNVWRLNHRQITALKNELRSGNYKCHDEEFNCLEDLELNELQIWTLRLPRKWKQTFFCASAHCGKEDGKVWGLYCSFHTQKVNKLGQRNYQMLKKINLKQKLSLTCFLTGIELIWHM